MGGVSISYVSVWGGGLAVGHEIWLSNFMDKVSFSLRSAEKCSSDVEFPLAWDPKRCIRNHT